MVQWDDYGESSLTLLAVHCGIDKKNPTIPHDPSDFRRCIHLFECLEFGEGEIFSLLCMTASKYPVWKPFVKRWDELTQLYLEDKDKELSNRLYDALKECEGK